MQEVIPVLNTEPDGTLCTLTRQHTTISSATPIITPTRACPLLMTGWAISPNFGLVTIA